MSNELKEAIKRIFEIDDHLAFKSAACEIGCNFMASTLGGISKIEFERGQVGLRFFLFMAEMFTRYEWVSEAVWQEIEEIIKDYRESEGNEAA
jgi:hypothetical protein